MRGGDPGLFRGMGHDALAEIGVGFSLFETPRLAQLVTRIAAEEQAARRAARAAAIEAMDMSRQADEAGEVTPLHLLRRGISGEPARRGRRGLRGEAVGGEAGLAGAEPAPGQGLGQARIRRRAISPSIWRSASTYRSICSRSWFASGV